METTDTVTRQYVEGCGITETEPDLFLVEPIRVMTPREIKEREEMYHRNTTQNLRARALLATAIGNGHNKRSFGNYDGY